MKRKEYAQEFFVPLPRPVVWKALSDPEIVRDLLVGCEELTLDSHNRYRFRFSFGVGPLKRSMKGTIKLSDIEEPSHFHFRRGSFQPYKGPGAFAGRVQLTEESDGTRIAVAVQIEMNVLSTWLTDYFTPKRLDRTVAMGVKKLTELIAER